MQEKIINILEKLVSYQSITPNDEGCQDFIANYLQGLGFGITKKKYDDVDNLIAKKGFGKPIIAFAGHTDVVPAGDVEKWNSNPFKLTKNKGTVVGRGVADMKGSIACMLIAIEHFLDSNPSHNGSIVVVLTSDEEGIAINGIKKLIEKITDEDVGTIASIKVILDDNVIRNNFIKTMDNQSLSGKDKSKKIA